MSRKQQKPLPVSLSMEASRWKFITDYHGAGDYGHGVNLKSGALTVTARGIQLL